MTEVCIKAEKLTWPDLYRYTAHVATPLHLALPSVRFHNVNHEIENCTKLIHRYRLFSQ